MTTPKQSDVFDQVDAAEPTCEDGETVTQAQWFAPAMADAEKFSGRTLEVVWRQPDNDK